MWAVDHRFDPNRNLLLCNWDFGLKLDSNGTRYTIIARRAYPCHGSSDGVVCVSRTLIVHLDEGIYCDSNRVNLQ